MVFGVLRLQVWVYRSCIGLTSGVVDGVLAFACWPYTTSTWSLTPALETLGFAVLTHPTPNCKWIPTNSPRLPKYTPIIRLYLNPESR